MTTNVEMKDIGFGDEDYDDATNLIIFLNRTFSLSTSSFS